MALKVTRGIVIAEQPLNDTDKLLTIFSEEGKFKAVANGVKNPKSTLASGCRLFAWSEFQYYPGKNLVRISKAHLIDSFYNISTDLKVVSYASYILDLVNNFYDDYQIDKLILKNLVYYLFYLNKNPDKVYLLTLASQIKLLIANGIVPDIQNIKFLDLERPIYFNISKSNFSNAQISNNYNYRISRNDIDILFKLLKFPINQINKIDVNKINSNLIHLIEIFNLYIQFQEKKVFKSFQILKELTQSTEELHG